VNDYLRDRLTVAVGTQYQVEREIGRGGMSVVYRAIDSRLHRTVAIKVLPPDIAFNDSVRTRFIREAQTAAQLSHPNIVPIYSVDEVGGEVSGSGSLAFIVMAYIEGESLGQHLAREGCWPVDQTVRVLREVADALAYAHARGVVHRDIKPDNILIDRASGRPMVTDFGIARAKVGETRITATGVAVGTPAYMSPEQALGERDVDGRSDLYSLAVVGYHMLTGDTPFQAVNTPAMLVKHVSERPRPIRERRSDVPAYLAVAIDRALAKKPEDRWSDAAEFRDALAGAQASHRRRQAWTPPSSQIPPYPGGAERSASSAAVPAPSTAPMPPQAQSPARHFPLPPPGMSRKEVRRWYKDQRRLLRSEERAAFDREVRVIGLQLQAHQRFEERPLDERVDAFRHSVMNWAGVSGVLMVVNGAMTGGPPWFLIPSGLMFLNVLRRGVSIWTDGVGPIDAFKKGIRARLRAERGAVEVQKGIAAPLPPPPPPPTPEQLAAQLAPPDVLAGPYGDTIKRAAADRALMRDITSSFGAIERDLIPDVGPTVDALAQRVGVVATTLHRLDADVSGASLGALDQRLASLPSEPDTPERERRQSLLQRQRNSLADLLERRRSLASQLESASLMLQNLKFDLLKFRSSGLGSQIEDNTHATQEARALSRDIGHAVEAAEELRKL
jgi:serine/threonine-protein kinase